MAKDWLSLEEVMLIGSRAGDADVQRIPPVTLVSPMLPPKFLLPTVALTTCGSREQEILHPLAAWVYSAVRKESF